jgi:hypothetical protein
MHRINRQSKSENEKQYSGEENQRERGNRVHCGRKNLTSRGWDELEYTLRKFEFEEKMNLFIGRKLTPRAITRRVRDRETTGRREKKQRMK